MHELDDAVLHLASLDGHRTHFSQSWCVKIEAYQFPETDGQWMSFKTLAV